MLLYPSGAQRVETDGEEKAEEEIDDRPGPEEIPDRGYKNNLCCPIDRYPFVKGLDLAEPRNAKDLEKWIEKQPKAFADKIVVDQLGFPAVWQVGVELVDPLEGVVFDMVAFE